ncbi:M23 family metallopeptidase [Periweissella cryptocerci]|uniref:M23 family metallopeptidase n=1 Tax=Periweissella cryptocerci TaxID=2506420 RepID=A0A4P6YW25_9LACO|nr:M23 family metallopeptidase [Periweissella cryptocerci]QBO37000.1 M23 family metallopeptidase [Periweissella cryptocerci]
MKITKLILKTIITVAILVSAVASGSATAANANNDLVPATASQAQIKKLTAQGFTYSTKTGYIWPVKGSMHISSGEGSRHLAYAATNFHYGYDFVPGKSKSFYAMRGGIVIAAGAHDRAHNFQMAGNVIIVKQDDGKYAVYSEFRNGSQTVRRGQYVAQGQKLGTMGVSGMTSGTHVHIGITNQAWPGYGRSGVSMAGNGRKGWVMLHKYLDVKRVYGEGRRSAATITTGQLN